MPPRRKTYHHGDLRSALIGAALALIAEGGANSVTVAEVARRAEVSGGAPYRHFSGRLDLLASAAAQAARDLTARLREAGVVAPDRSTELDAVQTSATAAAEYARYVAEHGAGFDVIFSDELRGLGHLDLIEAGRGLIDTLFPTMLAVTGGDPAAAIVLLERQIAAAHGYAVLFRNGFLSGRDATVDDIAHSARWVARQLALALQAD